jgi:hypothetical protein
VGATIAIACVGQCMIIDHSNHRALDIINGTEGRSVFNYRTYSEVDLASRYNRSTRRTDIQQTQERQKYSGTKSISEQPPRGIRVKFRSFVPLQRRWTGTLTSWSGDGWCWHAHTNQRSIRKMSNFSSHKTTLNKPSLHFFSPLNTNKSSQEYATNPAHRPGLFPAGFVTYCRSLRPIRLPLFLQTQIRERY